MAIVLNSLISCLGIASVFYHCIRREPAVWRTLHNDIFFSRKNPLPYLLMQFDGLLGGFLFFGTLFSGLRTIAIRHMVVIIFN